jgi:hypothetical protein
MLEATVPMLFDVGSQDATVQAGICLQWLKV